MAESEKQTQSPASSPTPGPFRSPAVALALILVCVVIAILAAMGYIPFPFIDGLADYTITPPATIGEYRSIDFRDQLIPLLGSGGSTEPSGYTFYLGSGAGNPPPGLTLGSDGILKGTPTAEGDNFQVCVRDANGRSVCRTYHLAVVVVPLGICPTELDPPCHAVMPGGIQGGNISVAGGGVPPGCPCPRGSHPGGVDNTSYPGIPITICVCDTPAPR